MGAAAKRLGRGVDCRAGARTHGDADRRRGRGNRRVGRKRVCYGELGRKELSVRGRVKRNEEDFMNFKGSQSITFFFR